MSNAMTVQSSCWRPKCCCTLHCPTGSSNGSPGCTSESIMVKLPPLKPCASSLPVSWSLLDLTGADLHPRPSARLVHGTWNIRVL